MMQMTHRQFPNSYIASLCKAQQQWGDMGVSPTRDGNDGFVEIPLETDPRREKSDQAETCMLSRRELQDLQAQVAEVMEIQEGTHFVGIRLPDGREETAYCNYSDRLRAGDELYVTVRQRGRQRTIKILGLVAPDRKEG